MEILPLSVSTDRALALVGPDVVPTQGSRSLADHVLVDVLVGGVPAMILCPLIMRMSH